MGMAEPVSNRGSAYPNHHSYSLPRRLHLRTEGDVDKFSSNSADPDAWQSSTLQSMGDYDFEGDRVCRPETIECLGPPGDGQTRV
jgi:hypothetical protein